MEFEPGAEIGFFEIYDMEQELSRLWGERKGDSNTPHSLSKYFRDRVMKEAEEQDVRP